MRRVEIRTATLEDASVIAALRAAAVPYLVRTSAGVRARLTHTESSGCWLALIDEVPAGFALTRIPYDAASRVAVLVHPALVRRGVGSALVASAETQVLADGGTAVIAVAHGTTGRDFAIARGYEVGREQRFSQADVVGAPAPPAAPAGIELRPLEAVDPRCIWALHERVGPDDPSGMSVSPPYDIWYEEQWAFPEHAADLGVAALDGDELVAFTNVFADRERGAIWSGMTGVVPDHRGQGLARLVKAHALRAAREAGMTTAFTANDAANAPMLAVNTWLDYRPCGQAWSVRGPARAGSLRH